MFLADLDRQECLSSLGNGSGAEALTGKISCPAGRGSRTGEQEDRQECLFLWEKTKEKQARRAAEYKHFLHHGAF